MYKMKSSTGRDIICRNHTVGMNKVSFDRLMHDLRTSHVHRPTTNTSAVWKRQVVDPRTVGASKLLAMKPSELQKFRYGPGRVSVDKDEDEDDPDIVFLFGEAGLDIDEASQEGNAE